MMSDRAGVRFGRRRRRAPARLARNKRLEFFPLGTTARKPTGILAGKPPHRSCRSLPGIASASVIYLTTRGRRARYISDDDRERAFTKI